MDDTINNPASKPLTAKDLSLLQFVFLTHALIEPIRVGDHYRDGAKVGHFSRKSMDLLIAYGLLSPLPNDPDAAEITENGRELCRLADCERTEKS